MELVAAAPLERRLHLVVRCDLAEDRDGCLLLRGKAVHALLDEHHDAGGVAQQVLHEVEIPDRWVRSHTRVARVLDESKQRVEVVKLHVDEARFGGIVVTPL